MILYNVTIKIENQVAQNWLDWMELKHIKDVLATGMFESALLMRLQTQDDDDQHSTFCVQYTATDMDKINHYQQAFAPALQAEHSHRYQGKFVAFRSYLEVLAKF